jgi:hypothetical protein
MYIVIIHFKRTIRSLKSVKSINNTNRISNIEEGNLDLDEHTPSPETNPPDSANFNANAGTPSSTTTAAETAGKRALPSRKIFQVFKQLVSPLTPAPPYTSQPRSDETSLGRPSPTTPGSRRFWIWTSPIRSPFSAPPLSNFGTASIRSPNSVCMYGTVQGTRTGTGTTPNGVQAQPQVVSPLRNAPASAIVECEGHCPTCPLAKCQPVTATVINSSMSPIPVPQATMAHLASLWLQSPLSAPPSTRSHIPMQPKPSGSRLAAPTEVQLEPVPEYRRTIHPVTSKDSIRSNDSRRDSIGISEQDPEDDPERYPHSHPRPLPHPQHGFAFSRNSNHPLTSNQQPRHRNSLSLSIQIPPRSPGAHRRSKSSFHVANG